MTYSFVADGSQQKTMILCDG